MTIEQLKQKTIDELKVMAYDQMLLVQQAQQQAQLLQQIIADKSLMGSIRVGEKKP